MVFSSSFVLTVSVANRLLVIAVYCFRKKFSVYCTAGVGMEPAGCQALCPPFHRPVRLVIGRTSHYDQGSKFNDSSSVIVR